MVSPAREEKQKQEAQDALELLSPAVCRIFDRYLNRYFAKKLPRRPDGQRRHAARRLRPIMGWLSIATIQPGGTR